jgi:hypothetical protein
MKEKKKKKHSSFGRCYIPFSTWFQYTPTTKFCNTLELSWICASVDRSNTRFVVSCSNISKAIHTSTRIMRPVSILIICMIVWNSSLCAILQYASPIHTFEMFLPWAHQCACVCPAFVRWDIKLTPVRKARKCQIIVSVSFRDINEKNIHKHSIKHKRQ